MPGAPAGTLPPQTDGGSPWLEGQDGLQVIWSRAGAGAGAPLPLLLWPQAARTPEASPTACPEVH